MIFFSSSETQYGANWAEPGFGTRAYMDCMNSHSEGGAGGIKITATLGTNIIADILINLYMSYLKV